MKYLQFIAFLFLASCIAFTSCQNEPTPTGTAAYIPANATNVTGFDIKRLIKKADFDEIKDMEFYREIVADAKNPIIAEAIEDPTKSGIDLNGRIYISTDIAKNDHERFSTHVIVPLSNASDFEKLVASADMEFNQENGLRILAPDSDSSSAMIWDDNILTINFSNQSMDVISNAKKIFDLQPEQSLAQNKDFAKVANSDHDMVTWMTTNTLAKNPAAKMAFTFIDIDASALKENYIHGYGDFENGKIVGHTDFYFNDELEDELLNRLFHENQGADFSKVLPSDDLAFAMTGAINFRGIDKFLSERPQNKKYADLVINDFAGFERKEILETLSGDMMIAAYPDTEEKSGNFIAALAIKNKSKAKEMLENALSNKKIKEVAPNYYKIIAVGGGDFSIQINKGIGHFLHMDDMLVYSPNKDILEQINNGEIKMGGNGITDATQHFKNQSIAGWVNFQKFGNDINELPPDLFKDIRFNMNMDGADFIMETNEPNKNSLKILFEMIEESYLKNNREAM